MGADAVLKVAVLFDLFELLLLLFLGAGADSSGYSMLDRIPSVTRSVSWMRLDLDLGESSYTGHFDPSRTKRKAKTTLLPEASVLVVVEVKGRRRRRRGGLRIASA